MSLFVPLATEPFRAFERGAKTVEIRQDAPRWGDRALYEGRRVRLRRGYSTPDQLMGVVGRVWRGLWMVDMPPWVVVGVPLAGLQRYFDTTRPIVAFEVLDVHPSPIEVGGES